MWLVVQCKFRIVVRFKSTLAISTFVPITTKVVTLIHVHGIAVKKRHNDKQCSAKHSTKKLKI